MQRRARAGDESNFLIETHRRRAARLKPLRVIRPGAYRRASSSSFQRPRRDGNPDVGDAATLPPHVTRARRFNNGMVSGFRANALQFLERRLEKQGGRRPIPAARRTRNADGYVSGMCERASEGGRAPYEEYPSREHVIYLPGDRRPCERLVRRIARERESDPEGERDGDARGSCLENINCHRSSMFRPATSLCRYRG